MTDLNKGAQLVLEMTSFLGSVSVVLVGAPQALSPRFYGEGVGQRGQVHPGRVPPLGSTTPVLGPPEGLGPPELELIHDLGRIHT